MKDPYKFYDQLRNLLAEFDAEIANDKDGLYFYIGVSHRFKVDNNQVISERLLNRICENFEAINEAKGN